MKCRHCSVELHRQFVDLGSAPPSNAYLSSDGLGAPEKYFPLVVMVCESCWLVQTQDFAQADELFASDYAYFSGFSTSWLTHAQRYVSDMVERFRLGPASHVVEVASNDGYLLQYVRDRNIPCLGIEPTASTAKAARAKGIETLEVFFGEHQGTLLAKSGRQADLMVANNVLAHVPDINDFLIGFDRMLKPGGVVTFEFPHLLRLIDDVQFDTIYHEHFSYLSLTSVAKIFASNGLHIFDVDEIPTHGGSLRVFAQHLETGRRPAEERVAGLLRREADAGMCSAATYAGFQTRAERVKDDFLRFLLDAKAQGKRVAAYGAAAKGNTLMNFAGCRPDLIQYVADRNPAKQDKYMPGSRIPIVCEDHLLNDRPDFVVIFPWNIKEEVMSQLRIIRTWQGQFVTAVPSLEIMA